MGLNTRGSGGSNKTFINVFQGNLVLEYDNQGTLEKKLDFLGLPYDTDEVNDGNRMDSICVRQKTKGKNEGKDVFYYILRDVSGNITEVTLTENDWGEFLQIELTDVDEKFSISLGDVSSRMAKDFVRRMGNIDLSKELVFGVWSISAEDADNGKPKSGVRMYQDDTKLEYFIEYDELPEPDQKKKGRKIVWDFTDQEEFLYDALTKWKDENFSATEVENTLPEKEEETKTTKRKPRTASKSKEEKSDVPF